MAHFIEGLGKVSEDYLGYHHSTRSLGKAKFNSEFVDDVRLVLAGHVDEIGSLCL